MNELAVQSVSVGRNKVEEFFVNYHKMLGKTYSIIDVKVPGEARRRIKDGMRAKTRK